MVGEVWDVCPVEGSNFLEMGFEKCEVPFPVALSAPSLQLKMWDRTPATVSVAILAAMPSASLSHGAISPSKLFLLYIALVMLFHHSYRKVTNTRLFQGTWVQFQAFTWDISQLSVTLVQRHPISSSGPPRQRHTHADIHMDICIWIVTKTNLKKSKLMKVKCKRPCSSSEGQSGISRKLYKEIKASKANCDISGSEKTTLQGSTGMCVICQPSSSWPHLAFFCISCQYFVLQPHLSLWCLSKVLVTHVLNVLLHGALSITARIGCFA